MTEELSKLPEPKSPEDLASAFNLSIQLTDELLKAHTRLEDRVSVMENDLAVANRQLAEKVDELNRTTQFLNNVVSSMHSGLIAVDLQERIVAFNQASEEILGMKASGLLGKPYQDIVKEKGAGPATGKFRRESSSASVSIRQALKEGSLLLNIERELLRPDGSTVGVSSSISALRDGEGNILGAVEIFKDLSEIRRLEERLERSDRLAVIGQMSATVAHEIRNPLNGIEGFASLLEREFPEEDSRHRYASNILEGVRTLNKTVTDLLQFARPTRLNFRACRLSEIFEHALMFLREEIDHPRAEGRAPQLSSDIQIETYYDDDIDAFIADTEHLRGTFLNFLLNAAQAMPDGGKLEVTTGPAKLSSHILIRIADTGEGIPPEIQKQLFTPFLTTKEHGTGLGLALAKKVIDSHQGTILVESEPGKGTTFIITLPRDPRAE